MLHHMMQALAVGMIAGIAWAGVPSLAAAAEDDMQTVLKADRALAEALGRSDKKTTRELLDRDFAWTDVEGKTLTKAEVVDKLPALAANSQGDADVQTHFYRQAATILGVHHNARFLRIWVKRATGWRAFVMLDTPIPTAPPQQASIEAAAGQGDCDNPCRSVPYTPRTAMDKAILATWQRTKMVEWKPNAEEWAKYIADEFLIVNNTTMRNREQRVVIAKKQQEAGVGAPGDPIVSMRIYDFGTNAAVMVSHHVPYRGGKPYHNIRMWVLRDGRWQLALSQQSTIQAAGIMTATTSSPPRH